MKTQRVAVVTGATRVEGIGFAVCGALAKRGVSVVLTGRSIDAARARAKELADQGLPVTADQLDITDVASVAAFASRHGAVDILVNNAAVTTTFGEKPSLADIATARAAIDTIVLGTWRVTRALLPQLRRSSSARIVNVSSGAGSHGDTAFGLTTNNAMGPSYAVAKSALNALTVTFARELRSSGILVNAVCPGFTATFPGAEAMGARPVEKGAASVVWAAMLEADGPTGGFFRDGAPLPW